MREDQGDSEVSKPMTPVESELRSVSDNLSKLSEVLSVLERKINPVLQAESPKAEGSNENSRDTQGSSDMVRKLNDIAMDVESKSKRVQYLIERVEL